MWQNRVMNVFSDKNSLLSRPTKIDWWMIVSIIPIIGAGLVTMHSFGGIDSFASRQIILVAFSLVILFCTSYFVNARLLKPTIVSVSLFFGVVIFLSLLFIFGKASHGAQSWFDFGLLSFQPSDFAKVALIIILAKYFSRRHIEIANIKHILVSGFYAFVFFVLVLTSPDLGSAMIIALIWLGMILVSGVSKKHLLGMLAIAIIAFALLWSFAFKEYQKDRIRNFIDPYSDIRGAGYNAYQSAVAVGSGNVFGKGVGYGTQSRLKFLPEYQTDFIFAAFAEEWGFIGVVILFSLYGILIWRIILIAVKGSTNFEILFGSGVAIYFIVHIAINVGMNIRLLPVTGTPLPFMSYGGTHILSECILLGLLMSINQYSRIAHKDRANSISL